MTETTIPEQHIAILKLFHDRLTDPSMIWAITGSTSFALQGMSIMPNDIDIQTDEASAYAIEALFSDEVQTPVKFSGTETIRSHFGKLKFNGVMVELMGALQKRQANGSWEAPVDVKQLRVEVRFRGMILPVLPLEYEYQAYLKLGRTERAQQIKTFLTQQAQ